MVGPLNNLFSAIVDLQLGFFSRYKLLIIRHEGVRIQIKQTVLFRPITKEFILQQNFTG